MKKAREGGKEALKTKPRSGRPPKLSEEQRSEKLPSLLEKGPEHFGFRGDVWTRKRVREVIKEEFRVEYDVSQVGRILVGSGGVAKNPTTAPIDHRSDKRDEEAIEKWKEQEWPRIKKTRIKKAETNDRTVMFVDEAGFYQLPAAVRTWAPRGETPVLRAPLNYGNLSAISGTRPSREALHACL